jgi:transposase
MAKALVTDELWEVIELLLPQEPSKPKGGRPRVPDRTVLTGILFVLKTGISWEMLPQEMGMAISAVSQGLREAARYFGRVTLCRLRLPLLTSGNHYPWCGSITRSSLP